MTANTKEPETPIDIQNYAPAGLSRLMYDNWHYVHKGQEQFEESDWRLMQHQREEYYGKLQAEHVLRLLRLMKDDPSFGYEINTYQHCLQAATKAARDGQGEETIVVALLHDIGFITCPTSHGAFAAALLGPYISDANHWMLVHHGAFQCYHCHGHPWVPDRHVRERWRGHPHFEWTADFVAKYDQCAMDPAYDNAPLDYFEPMVHRLFAREPKPYFRGREVARDSLDKNDRRQ